MSKRGWQPTLNSWVLIPPPRPINSHRSKWKDAFPALVCSVSLSGEVSVLVPNMLVLQHGFQGSAYMVRDGLNAKDMRVYEGRDRQALTQVLLIAFMQDTCDAGLVPSKTWRTCSKQHVGVAAHLDQLLHMVPDFAGRLAEYLWSEVATGQMRDETVSRQDINWLSDGKHATHSVPIKEPEMFRFMRTSTSICSMAIGGLKIRLRTVCDSGVSLRFSSIICGISKAAFPQRWASSRCLQRVKTLEEEQEMIDIALEDMQNVQQDRRAALRKRLAGQMLSPEEVERLKEYGANFSGYDVPSKTPRFVVSCQMRSAVSI